MGKKLAPDDDPVPPLTDEIKRCQILGVTELAPFLGVRRSTIHVWNYRQQLPPPDFPTVNNNVAWRRLTIIQWAATTGRIRPDAPDWLRKEAKRWEPEGGFRRRRRTKAEIEADKKAAAHA